MIGLVIVSHSARLAEGVCELARQVGQDQVRLAAAGGTSGAESQFGTDAFRVLQAIESVYSEDGVLVLMDLGSAVLSAETALELLGPEKQARVRLCGLGGQRGLGFAEDLLQPRPGGRQAGGSHGSFHQRRGA